MKRTGVFVLVFGVAVGVFAVGAATAAGTDTGSNTIECTESTDDVPEDRDAVLLELRQLDGLSSAEEFSEFELVRSEAVVAVQTGEFTDEDLQRNQNVISALKSFERAYNCYQDGRFDAAMDEANRTAELAEDLSGDRGAQYQTVIDIGLARFYEQIGDELVELGEQQEATPERIDRFSMAATAFQEADAVDKFSQLSTRQADLESELQRDMEDVDDALSEGEIFIDQCHDCTDPTHMLLTHGIDVFDYYQSGVIAQEELEDAQELLAQHRIEDEDVQSVVTDVEERTTALAIASLSLFAGGTLVVGLTAALFARRLLVWKQDVDASRVGDLLLWGGIIND